MSPYHLSSIVVHVFGGPLSRAHCYCGSTITQDFLKTSRTFPLAVQPLSDGPHQIAVRPGPDARLGVRREVRAVQEAKARADFCRVELPATGLGLSRAMAALGSIFEYITPR